MKVKQSFFWNGVLYPVGKQVDAGDPVVKGRESLFTAPESKPVEQATAVPGEKRPARRKSAAKK